jgi:hypothetical protein
VEKTIIIFRARSTCGDLKLNVSVNHATVLTPVLDSDFREFAFEIDEVDNSINSLSFEMTGKTADHTRIDNNGNILSDQVIEIESLSFDGVNLGALFFQKSFYRHDFNGSQSLVTDQFYGTIGCNGVVELEFSSPCYIWLLENM